MDRGLLTSVLINIAVTLGALVVLDHVVPVPVSLPHVLLVLGYLVAAVFCIGADILADRHWEWLSKGHLRVRATEVLVPPAGLLSIRRLLESDVADLPGAEHTLVTLRRRYRWLALMATTAAPALALVGIGLSLWALTKTHLGLIHGTLPLPATPWADIAGYLTSGAMGVVLGLSCFVFARGLTSALTQNIEKVLHLFEKRNNSIEKLKFDFRVRTRVSQAVLFFALGLVPLAALEGYTLVTMATHEKKVAVLTEDKEALDRQNKELGGNLDVIRKESATLAEKLQKQIDDNKKLTRDLKRMTDTADARQKQNLALQANLTSTTQTLSATQVRVTSLTADLKTANATLKKLDDTLRADVEKAKKANQAAEKQAAELTARVTSLTADLTTARADVASLKKDLETARKQANSRPTFAPAPDLPDTISLANGRLIVATDTLFQGKSDQLRPEAGPVLTRLAALLKGALDGAAPNVQAIVAAHTDIVPPSGQSQDELTAAQARALHDALTQRGISAKRLVATGMADRFERDARLTDEALAKNRRVEIILTDTLR